VDAMRTSGARWAWVLAASFLLGTIWLVLVTQNITVHGPDIADDANLPDAIFENFRAAREAFPQEMAYTLLFSLGFLALAVLGPILRAILDRSGPTGTRLAVLFLVAGTIGILSQVINLGGKEVATAPYYCDCDYLAPQLISRGAVLDALGGIQSWMVDAFTFLFAVGLLAAAGLARAHGWGAGFVRASQVLALLGLGSAAWNRIGVPLLVNADVHMDYYGLGLLILGVIAGVATPIWAVLLARALSREAPPAST
jgi:hypothetical protein